MGREIIVEHEDLPALVARVAKCDEEAFVLLHAAICDRVHAITKSIVRDSSLAEDVAQEVFLQVWSEADRYRDELGTVEAWVNTISRRRSIDRVRMLRNTLDRESVVRSRSQLPPADDTFEKVQLRLEHQKVQEALATLTAVQRDALLLAYYQGKTYREVAEMLSVPEGTAKARLRDAIRRLRGYLIASQ